MFLFESFIQVKQSLEHDIFIKTNSLVIDRYLRYQARPKNLNTKIALRILYVFTFFGGDETIPVNLVNIASLTFCCNEKIEFQLISFSEVSVFLFERSFLSIFGNSLNKIINDNAKVSIATP